MILQNIMFPSVDNCTEERLFFRRTERTKYSFAENCIYLKKKAAVNFDSFYNSFSASKWYAYTALESLRLRMFIQGKVRVSVLVKQSTKDKVLDKCVFESYYDSNEEGAEYFDALIDTPIDGNYSVMVAAVDGDAQVQGGYFYTEDSAIQNASKLSVVINCTGHEKYVYKNVSSLCAYAEANQIIDRLRIEVIDSEGMLNPAKLNKVGAGVQSQLVSVFKSRDELAKELQASTVSNVMVLDEDAIVIPETTFRMLKFLSLLKPEHKDLVLTGTLLSFENQWKRITTGSESGFVDFNNVENGFKNENKELRKFHHWWISVLPVADFLAQEMEGRKLNTKTEDGNQVEATRINSLCAWHSEDDFKHSVSSAKELLTETVKVVLSNADESIIKLQNILFPSEDNCTEEALYFRRQGNTSYSYADDCVILRRDALLHMDTYFNSLSASKWFKYTTISKVKVRLFIKGKVRVSLLYKERTASGIVIKCLRESYFDSDEDGEIFDSEFSSDSTNGMYCISILGVGEESKFQGGFYYTEDVTPREVGLTIGICTFKREKYVYKNIEMLEKEFLMNSYSELREHLYINISDNAKTLDPEKFHSDHIKVFQNKNAGGAGGFTRTIIETKKMEEANKLTHILLMDDDVVMQPESIFRTYKILTLLKEEFKTAFIGGAMLRTDLQWFQTEAGGTWHAGRLVSHKQGLDLRDVGACLYNEVEEKYDFEAWWYCTMPLSIINDENLPMPIFIRGDDVEFGLRNMKYLILMNGICVWHEPFENKYSSSMFYYIFRNRLIDNAVRNIEYTKEEFLEEFKAQYFRELFTLRYKNASLLMEGARDFLKGPEWLMAQDGEKLNMDIMSRCYKLQNINDLKMAFDYPQYEQMLHFVESPEDQRKRKMTLNGLFAKPTKIVNVPVQDAHIAYFYKAKGAVNYDSASNKAFETYFDRKEEIALIKDYFKFKKEVKKGYDQAKKNFLEKKGVLNGIDFWKKYLNL